jgi:hypothetical protein
MSEEINKEAEKNVEPQKRTGDEHLRLVLNGGNTEMNSAIIPIQWFFSEEAGEMGPTHIIIADYKGVDKDRISGCKGIRYICEVKDTLKNIEFFSPGDHTLYFMAVRSRHKNKKGLRSEIQDNLSGYTGFGGRVVYHNHLTFDENKDFLSVSEHYAAFSSWAWEYVASNTVQVSVPKEFFAERSKNPIVEAIWNFTNGSLRGGVIDQCHARKRFLTVLPLKILTVLPLRIFFGLVSAIITLLYSILSVFFAWRPFIDYSDLKNVWNFNRRVRDMEPNEYLCPTKCRYSRDEFYGYRVFWKKKNGNPGKIPVAPWLATLTFFGLWIGSKIVRAVIFSFSSVEPSWIMQSLRAIVILVCIALIVKLLFFLFKKTIIKPVKLLCNKLFIQTDKMIEKIQLRSQKKKQVAIEKAKEKRGANEKEYREWGSLKSCQSVQLPKRWISKIYQKLSVVELR